MLTPQQNARLTQVGPGTPGGELLRRYWQALCPTKELSGTTDRKRIRLLGEDLVVFRDAQGQFRCGSAPSYMGPKLNRYPVQQLGGVLFAYLGPDPAKAPLLPRWDVLVRNDRPRRILVMPLHQCNWLQIQENTVDTVHTYYLHGHRSAMQNGGKPDPIAAFFYRPIKSYDWRVCEWGVEKLLEYGGDQPELEIRPPLIFPNLLRIPQGPNEALHFRIPVDDGVTRIIWVGLGPVGSGAIVPDHEVPYDEEFDPPGQTIENVDITNFYGQDRVVWETQGAVTDRRFEHLGASDRGIVLFRRMLAEQIDRVERGQEPTVAVVRDPEKNVCITFDDASEPWHGNTALGVVRGRTEGPARQTI